MAAGESSAVTWRPITTENYQSEMERLESTILYFQPASANGNTEGEEVSKHSLQFPDYSDQAIRLQSFKHWGGVLPAQELAEGGFYMIARRDVVRCFSCKVVVQDWERSDNVIDKHCKHNPNCSFLEQLLNNVMKSATLSFSSSSKGRNIPEDERIIFENSLPDDTSVDPTSTPLDQHDPQLLPVFPTMESRDEVQSINSNNIDVIYPSLHIPISSSNQCWIISDAQLPVTSGHNASHDNPQQGMDDNIAGDISYLPAGRDQNIEPFPQSSTLFLNPSGIMKTTSPPRHSSCAQSSLQQDDADLRRVPTISQPSTATNSDSSSGSTMPIELDDDDDGCHGSMFLNFSGGDEEMDVTEYDPQQYSHLCQICYDEEVRILLLPCRHAKMCEICASHIVITQNKPCPHCKTPVEDIRRIYL